jgi:branched-chain amino acid transport system permease protein
MKAMLQKPERAWWALWAAAAAALLAVPQFVSSYGATLLLVYAVLALSLGLVWGLGGILCFGQGAFFGLGAYAYAIAAINFQAHAWGTLAALLLAVAVAGVFAGLLGAMMFYGRISDVYLGVITLVVTLILFKTLNAASGPDDVIGQAPLGGFNGIPGYPLPALGDPAAPWLEFSGDALYYLCAAVVLAAWLGGRRFARGSAGRVLLGIRENELRAQLLGYDVRVHKTAIFAAGGALAGLAGVLYASWAEIVTPSLFSLGQSAEVIVWVIVGGLGTLAGPIAGALAPGLVKTLLANQSAVNNHLLLGCILLGAVLALPQGIAPALLRGWARWMAPARRHDGPHGRP